MLYHSSADLEDLIKVLQIPVIILSGANDFDKYAVQTYKANFGDHIVLGDINEIPLEIIPDCDILIGGFPCQPFSMMGQQKGFEDTRGTLFLE